ncbi:MAG: hypothetical protein AB4038_20955 [Prochloraceae cyanobacterium]
MKLLSEEQKQKIRQEFYKNWITCDNEMVRQGKSKTVTSSRQPVIFVLREVMKNVGVLDEIEYRPHRDVHKLINELELSCCTCGKKLDAYTEVGRYLGDDEFWKSHGYILNFLK